MSSYLVQVCKNLSIFWCLAVLVIADSGNVNALDNQSSGLAGSAPGSSSQDARGLLDSSLNSASAQFKNTVIPELWPTAPDWLKRTEGDIQFNSENGAQYNILTTQPLLQVNNKRDTIFMQASYEHYNLYDIGRNTVNAGVGYRRLMLDDQLLLGVNNFYDYEISHNHTRSSVGMDAKWGILDGYANYYYRLSGMKEVQGAQERVLNGYDVSIGAPLPYLPWAHLFAKYYEWYGIAAKNTTGGEFSAEFALHPNFTLVAGTRGDQPDDSRHNNYIMLQFRLGSDGRATLLSKPYSAQAFESRDLQDYALDKVRRENRIIIERTTKTTGGITVVVKKG